MPPQLIFDQEAGRLFTVRVAGNLATPVTIGSLTYAVEALGVRLVVVLGHEGCGAVEVALDASDRGDDPAAHGPLAPIIAALAPAVAACRSGEACTTSRAVRANVVATVEALRAGDGAIGRLARTGELRIAGAIYDIESDTVTFLDQAMRHAGRI